MSTSSHLSGFVGTKIYTYDFNAPAIKNCEPSILGGAIGSYNLDIRQVAPAGAVVKGAGIKVFTSLASGGAATVALAFEATDDVLAPTAFTSFVSTGTGIIDTKLDGTASTDLWTTEARDLVMTIAGADLTGGYMNIWLEYLIPSAAGQA